MRRVDGLAPRPGWERTVRDEGLTYALTERPDGRRFSYWNETAAYVFSPDEVAELESVTDELHRMCAEAARYLATGALGTLGLSEAAFELAQHSLRLREPSIYGRFDLAWDGTGPPKMLELNGDTPTGLVEGAICQWSRMEALFPGLGEDHPEFDQLNGLWPMLVDRWRQRLPYSVTKTLHVAYTREEESGEDAANAAVLANTAVEAGYRAVLLPVEDVRYDTRSRGWVHATGDVDHPVVVGPIEEIFALHPWEHMVDDGPGAFVLEDPTLMHHWYEPAWKMFQSNKLLLVALWRCFPGHENLLAAHPDGPGELREWVRKPVFGREGDGIELHARDLRIRSEHPHDSPLDVWQAYTPVRNFPGSDGAPNHPVIGSWVVGEAGAAGIGIRESDGPLTDYYCRFVPNVIDKKGLL